MDAAIMAEVRAGKRVCAVFYGHPGVFADVPHAVIRKARADGISARMEPGISAEACLYADLGIDPGRSGVLSLESTHFLVYQHTIDTSAHLLLRSEEHTSALQSLMRISYAVFCFKKNHHPI